MATYAAIQQQIATLEKEAKQVRAAELADVIAKMKQAIKTYGLTARDLGLSSTAGAGTGRRAAPATAGIPKYQDPKSGKTWTGHGKPPLWIAKKRNRDDFLIDKSAASTTASTPVAKPASAKKVVKAKAAAKPKAKATPVKAKAAKPAKAAAKSAPVKRAVLTRTAKTVSAAPAPTPAPVSAEAA